MQHMIDQLEGRQLFAGGALDTTFGTAGATTIAFRDDGTNISGRLVTDSGGRTYVVASAIPSSRGPLDSLQIQRLNRDESIDTSWAVKQKGDVLFSFPKAYLNDTQVLIDQENRLYVHVADKVYRLNPSGTLDATYANKGVLDLSSFATIGGLTLDYGDRLLVNGSVNTGSTAARYAIMHLQRFRTTGQADKSFGSGGVVNIRLPSQQTVGARVSNQGELIRSLSDKTIVAVAFDSTGVDGSFIGVRLLEDGTLDTAYGTDGISEATGFVHSDDESFATAVPSIIEQDGTIVVQTSNTDDDFLDEPAYGDSYITASGAVTDSGAPQAPNVSPYSYNSAINPTREFTLNGQSDLILDALTNTVYHTHADGSYDSSFNGGTPISGADDAALQNDGTLIIVTGSNVTHLLTVKRYFTDNNPVADLYGKPLTATASSLKFSVIYHGPHAIDASSLNGFPLRVNESNRGTAEPKLVTTTTLSDGSIEAIYKLTNLNGLPWTSSDDGTYTVQILGNKVKDIAGNFVAAAALGPLVVAIA